MSQRSIPNVRNGRAPVAALLLAVLGLAAWAPPAAAGIFVGFHAPILNVAPGDTFDLALGITLADSPFNGFNAVVEFDPGAVQFVPAVNLATQQGCLMTGACSAACGNTFHVFTPSPDSLAITDHLLCDQLSLTGPGNLYHLRFLASGTPQETWIRIRRATFYNAGLFVLPVTVRDIRVGIGVQVGVGSAPPARAGLSVRAEPNPSRGRLALAVESRRSGELRLEIHDVAGRLVRRLDAGWREAGVARVPWDGTDVAGARVRPGIYLVTARAGGNAAAARIAIVE